MIDFSKEKVVTELKELMHTRKWSVEELAQKIDHEPAKLASVLEGKAVLGVMAVLALYAVKNNLPPISK